MPVAVGSGQGRVGEEVARSRSGATAFVEPHRVGNLGESRVISGNLVQGVRRAAPGAAALGGGGGGGVESAERRLVRALSALVAAQ